MDSDEEFEYESEDGFQDDDQGDEDAIQIENAYYEADDNKASRPEEALKQFEQVVEMETARGSEVVWRFKSLQAIVILCARLGRLSDMAERYKDLLSYMDQVTRNDASEAINNVLDAVSQCAENQSQQQPESGDTDMTGEGGAGGGSGSSHLETVYSLTLDALKKSANHRLWFNTSVKLAKLYLERENLVALQKKLRELHDQCLDAEGRDDVQTKGSQLLELYALEIQMCARTKNALRMKEIYPKTINLTSAIADPRNVAVIRESGGKMYMTEKKWMAAYNEFLEAFKNFQETGNAPRAKMMLKCVVLANMLALSDINPFDSREAKVYQEDPEIAAMSQLRMAFDSKDVKTVDKILKDPRYKIVSDSFLRLYVEDLLRNIRLTVLESILQPYRSARLDFLCQELNVSREELTSLLVQLILDEKLGGGIDDVNGFVELYGQSSRRGRYGETERWSKTLRRVVGALHHRLEHVTGV